MDSTKRVASRSSWKRWIPDTVVLLVLYPLSRHHIEPLVYAVWMGFVLLIGQGAIVMRVVMALHETLTRWWGVE